MRKTLNIFPNVASPHFYMGLYLYHEAELEDWITRPNKWPNSRYQYAKKSFQEAVKIKPNFAKAHLMLGKTLIALGEQNAAESEWKTLNSLDRVLAIRLSTDLKKTGSKGQTS
jgi:tetratricopeptide (TPR) repeat protein